MGQVASSDFERLMADPRLAELNELHRGARDALDLIGLSENQNSDILAWLFDSREGHAQGDEILRDLLLHASKRAMDSDCLGPHSATRGFFARWSPSRLRTTSFGGAFPVREFGFGRESRTDLAIIDEQNQLIVVIENKTKTKHTDGQLNRYRSDFEAAIEGNRRLSTFVIAFVAMSEDFDYDETAILPCSDTWLHVGYGWLKPSADRAVRQVERGNHSAQLVASYCTLRTQWEDPLDHKRTLKAAELSRDYLDAVAELRSLVSPKMTAQWFQHEAQANPAMLFVLQNRATAQLLAKLENMEAIAARLRPLLGLRHDDDGIEWDRGYVNIRAPGVEHLSIDDFWVAYLNVEPAKNKEVEGRKRLYDLALVLKPDKFKSRDEEDKMRARCESVSKRKRARVTAHGSRSVLASGLDEESVLALIEAHYRTLGQPAV